MTHTRIRKFNTRDTYPEQNLDNDLCQAVATRGGTTLWMRGQCPQNPGRRQKHRQPRSCRANPQRSCRTSASSSKRRAAACEHLVKVIVYITDVRHREAVYRTMGEYIKGVHPVSTGLVVQALARPEWLVEIDATAVIPD